MNDDIVTQPAPKQADLSNIQVTDEKTAANGTARANLKRSLWDHGLLTFTFLLIVVGGTVFLNRYGAKQADKWAEGLRYALTNQQAFKQAGFEETEELKSYINKTPNATSAEKARLFKQLKEIENRARIHISVAIDFYVWNYLSISAATIEEIVAAISLFFLSKEGWEKANKYVVDVFVFSFSITVATGVFPALFRQEENISNNTRTYLAYIALDDRVNSYIATGRFTVFTVVKPANTKNAIAPETLTNVKDVIHSVDGELAILNNIYIGFDATKIPNYRQVFNEVNQ